MPLHACRVQPRSPLAALERSASCANALLPTQPSAFAAAVPLPPITALADQHLPTAGGPRTAEDPIPLVDHRRPARQFLDRRREASDTTSSSRDHAAPRKLGPLIRAFFLLWRARPCSRAQVSWPRSAPRSGSRPRSAPELRGLGEPPTLTACGSSTGTATVSRYGASGSRKGVSTLAGRKMASSVRKQWKLPSSRCCSKALTFAVPAAGHAGCQRRLQTLNRPLNKTQFAEQFAAPADTYSMRDVAALDDHFTACAGLR
jgi:hypothetical protein